LFQKNFYFCSKLNLTKKLKTMIKRLLSFAMMLAISISLSAQATWTQQNTNFTDVVPSTGVDQVSVVSPTCVWVKGFNGSGTGAEIKAFSRTNDAGTTWTAGHFTQLGTTEMPTVLAACSYTNAAVATYDTVAQVTGFWKTVDGGTTWTAVTGTFGASSFVDGVRFWNATQGFAYGDPIGTSPNKKFEIYTTNDAGATWTVNSNTPLAVPQTEYGYNGFDCSVTVPGGIAFIMTDHGRILKTTDFGATWAVTTAAPFTTAAYSSVKVYASSANYIIAASMATTSSPWVWMYTTDGGATWSSFAPSAPFYDWMMVYVPGTANMFVATSPVTSVAVGCAYSTDGGLTWTDYTDATYLQPGGANIQCLGVGFADQQNGWVGNYDAGTAINSILYFHDPTAGVTLNSVNGNDVNVYPNPSNGLVHFSVNGPNKSDISIKVFDMVGKVVFNENMNVNDLNSTSFDFTNYAKGMYMVQITSGNDIKTQKLVIR
jgi:photosystem II stability/assembly factor-like uncharacterized protein